MVVGPGDLDPAARQADGQQGGAARPPQLPKALHPTMRRYVALLRRLGLRPALLPHWQLDGAAGAAAAQRLVSELLEREGLR